MERHRGNRQTNLIRICYTSLYTFFISMILNEYCNANNETTLSGQGNTSELYRILDHSTWINGYEDCHKIYNLTMASSYDITENRQFFNFDNQLPVWIYAFEIVLTSGKVLRIQSHEISKHNNTYHCSNEHGATLSGCCKTLTEAKNICTEGNVTLTQITPETTKKFAQKAYTNETVWTTGINVSTFLKESSNLRRIRCLLWDRNGLRTDECTKSHRTLCIQGDTQAVIQYVKTEKITEYTTTTTTRHTSSKSPGSPSKQDSNNTKHSTTVSTSPNPVPVYQDIWMDPVIRYSLIAVGSVICVVLLVAVCCCYCKYRRRSENRRNSAHLAEAYSETADSIVMKETSVYESADTSEYAIPEDALKKARHRQSIGENEYDVLQNTNKTSKNHTGNAYNHVTLVKQDGRGCSNQEENMYDVTNYGKQNAVIITPNDLTGNIYGDVELKTSTLKKKEDKGS